MRPTYVVSMAWQLSPETTVSRRSEVMSITETAHSEGSFRIQYVVQLSEKKTEGKILVNNE